MRPALFGFPYLALCQSFYTSTQPYAQCIINTLAESSKTLGYESVNLQIGVLIYSKEVVAFVAHPKWAVRHTQASFGYVSTRQMD